MRTIILGLGMLLSTHALARESGNFRRTDVLNAAGARAGTVSAYHQKTTKDARISLVESGNKAILVKAPLDRSQPAKRLTTKQANRINLLTQAQARKLASNNGGILGSKKKVTVQATGVSASRFSYSFKQTSPSSILIRAFGRNKYRVSNINRSVTVGAWGGSAIETASGGKYDFIKVQ